MLLDEGDEAVDGIGLGDVHLDALLALVEADASSGCSHVSVVGIGHLAGTVDDAAHHADFQVSEVSCRLLHALHSGLQVKHGSATSWAGDKFGLADAQACRLQDSKGIAKSN